MSDNLLKYPASFKAEANVESAGTIEAVPYGDMLQNYYALYAAETRKIRDERLSSIKSAADAENEVRAAAMRVEQAFGKFPQDCPLEPKSFGVIEKNGVTIEKVLIQTRENIHATVLVYRKSGAVDVQPGILLVCGHSDLGKAAPHYQKLADSLARMGMTAVVIDPLGQGERKLYPGLNFSSVREHNLTGKQLSLAGEFFGLYRVYDAKRAVDYMFERSDIDNSRLGVAGVSGGGTLSSYTFALDRRIAAAAPSCYITGFLNNFENELPTDSEQIPQGLWSRGGEMIDLIISRAPSPCLVLSVENDYFDPRGTAASVEEAKNIYRYFGKEDNISLFVGPGSHDLPLELRDATCRFFAKHFMGACDDIAVPEGFGYPPEEILVLDGKMTHELAGEYTITKHIALKMDELACERKRNTPDIAEFLKKYLQIPEQTSVPQHRVLRGRRNGGRLTAFAVKTEPGAEAILMRKEDKMTYFHLPVCDKAVLYVGSVNAEKEMRQLEVAADTLFYSVDVRGTGKSRSMTCDGDADFFDMYDSDYFYDATGKLLNRPLLGGKVRDLLAVIKLLKTKCAYLEVHGSGLGGLIAAYAMAVNSEGVDKLVLNKVPESWRSFVNGKDIRWPQSVMIPDSLKYFDLPELYELLKSKLPTEILNYADQMME